MSGKMTYKEAGVDYNYMDAFKRLAQASGIVTSSNLKGLCNNEFCEVPMSRGESVYLIEAPDCYLAHVEEGLGTKNLVADAMYQLTGKTYYDNIAKDAVAMVVNDMITLGALPLSMAMHLAAGNSEWFKDEKRCHDLISGWREACNLAGCIWGAGETPTLKDIVNPQTVVLSGSAMGIIKPKKRLIDPVNISDGDEIILVASSGIHANGLTLARKLAEKLPKGYLEKIPGGQTFGEALLEPTHIYVPLIEELQKCGLPVHYAVNITGHGWRKLMRAHSPFTYVIERAPEAQPIFAFMQEHARMDDYEAYGNFNMGAGFALFVPKIYSPAALATIRSQRFEACVAGYIEQSREKRVVIKPKNIEFSAQTLNVRN